MTVATGLGSQQPDLATVGEYSHGAGEDVEEVPVAVAPPQQHGVDDVVAVLIQQLVAGQVLDRRTKLVIDVLVPTDLLHHLTRLEAESFGQAALALRLTRGRAHVYPSCLSGPAYAVYRFGTVHTL